MRKLHLVGFTSDRKGLIFSARRGSKSGGFLVAVEDALLESLAEEQRRRNGTGVEPSQTDAPPATGEAHRAGRPQSTLTPREMQARLRAGRTIAEVAAEAHVTPDWVARFAVPILAEQAQMVELARSLTYVKPRRGESAEPLGPSVAENLAERGVFLPEDLFDAAWSAFQLHDVVWIVRVRYRSRGRLQEAAWEVDVASGQLTSRNRLASDLGYVEKGRRRMPARIPVSPEPDAEALPEPPRRRSRPGTGTPRARSGARRRATGRAGTAASKAAARKAGARRPAPRKPAGKAAVPARKVVARKVVAGKATAGKATAGKAAAPTRKAAARKAAVPKSTSAGRAAARKVPARKVPARKTAARKTAARKTAARKTAARKTAARKVATPTAREAPTGKAGVAKASVGKALPSATSAASPPARAVSPPRVGTDGTPPAPQGHRGPGGSTSSDPGDGTGRSSAEEARRTLNRLASRRVAANRAEASRLAGDRRAANPAVPPDPTPAPARPAPSGLRASESQATAHDRAVPTAAPRPVGTRPAPAPSESPPLRPPIAVPPPEGSEGDPPRPSIESRPADQPGASVAQAASADDDFELDDLLEPTASEGSGHGRPVIVAERAGRIGDTARSSRRPAGSGPLSPWPVGTG